MKKFIIAAAAVAGVVGVAGIIHYAKKHMKVDIDVDIPDETTEDIETVETTEDVVETEEVVEEIINKIDDKLLRYELTKYLVINGVDQETIMCIGKVDSDIRDEIPEEYNKVKAWTADVIGSKFSNELIEEYFNNMFNLLYTSMIPSDVFMRYSDKIANMGDECQEDLMNLVEAIDTGINNDDELAITAFAKLYSILKYTPVQDFTTDMYQKEFKPFVDAFVVHNEEVSEEVVVEESVVDNTVEDTVTESVDTIEAEADTVTSEVAETNDKTETVAESTETTTIIEDFKEVK